MESTAPSQIIEALSTVLDPEIGVNIVDLGLVYGMEIENGRVRLEVTMTSPACPLSSYLQQSIERAVCRRLPAMKSVEVAIVWQPPWEHSMMSANARRELGWRD